MQESFNRKAIAIGTKTSDDALAHGTNERSVAKSLARMHIAEMHFHYWQWGNAADGITQCHRSVGVCTCIEHHTIYSAIDGRLLECIYERTFVVRLESGNLHSSSKLLLQRMDDVIKRLRSIDGGFSAA